MKDRLDTLIAALLVVVLIVALAALATGLLLLVAGHSFSSETITVCRGAGCR